MAQIKTWVANTWVKLLQTTGQSTNKAMSQKAVTDSLDSLKSDLVAKDNMLSYEEIMASTPPIDLNVGIPKASALKEIGGRILAGSSKFLQTTATGKQEVTVTFNTPLPNEPKSILLTWYEDLNVNEYCSGLNITLNSSNTNGFKVNTNRLNVKYDWNFFWLVIY